MTRRRVVFQPAEPDGFTVHAEIPAVPTAVAPDDLDLSLTVDLDSVGVADPFEPIGVRPEKRARNVGELRARLRRKNRRF